MKGLTVICVILVLASCVTNIEPIATTGFLARHGHAAVLVGDKIVVLNGSKGTDEFTHFRYEYLVRDYVASSDGITWLPVMPLGPFYGVGSRALVQDGLIIATGGAFSTLGHMSNVPDYNDIIYSNSSSGSEPWQVWGVMPVSLSHFGFAFFRGKFWILGGNRGVADFSFPYSGGNMLLSNAVYSRASGDPSWSQVLPSGIDSSRWSPREGHAVVVFDDRLWVIGGRQIVDDPSTGNPKLLSLGDAWSSPDGLNWTFETQSGDANRWEALGRAFHQVVVLNGALYLTGGIDQSPKYRFDTPAVHNDIQKSNDGRLWTTVATFTAGRFDHSATVKGDRIYIVGGRDNSQVFNDVVVYTP